MQQGKPKQNAEVLMAHRRVSQLAVPARSGVRKGDRPRKRQSRQRWLNLHLTGQSLPRAEEISNQSNRLSGREKIGPVKCKFNH